MSAGVTVSANASDNTGVAGVNRADILQRKGRYPAPADSPQDIPGLEYAGEVEALGPPAPAPVRRWGVGDRVMGLVGGGACAVALVAHADTVLAVAEKIRELDNAQH